MRWSREGETVKKGELPRSTLWATGYPPQPQEPGSFKIPAWDSQGSLRTTDNVNFDIKMLHKAETNLCAKSRPSSEFPQSNWVFHWPG